MVFVSVSFASSALLEGISRGVPCIVVRECNVEDYVPFDHHVVPVRDVAGALELIDDFTDRGHLLNLREKQSRWLEGVTVFPDDV